MDPLSAYIARGMYGIPQPAPTCMLLELSLRVLATATVKIVPIGTITFQLRQDLKLRGRISTRQ